MKQYRLVDTVVGWLAFLIAAFVYCSTIEPTASFWDCPEFIATGYKLEIGHPPGAPFFMLTANLFSHFASDPTQVAKWVNIMSALLSATTILFLFWSITHLARKLVVKSADDMTTAKLIAIEGSGLVGALIYTFSDTFWFSAVEGEVYAYSSAFTAIVFWLILKWEDHADEPHSDRWLVLIFYMTGLSIGVHLLNLLCLPAIVLVYCYRRFPNIEVKGSLIALLVSFLLVAAVLYGVIPGIVTVGGWFELFFVNVLGFSFNTGTIIYIFCLVGTMIWAIYESFNDRSQLRQNISYLVAVALLGVPFIGYGIRAAITGVVLLAVLWFFLTRKRKDEKGRRTLPLMTARFKNTSLLCMLMLIIGYSSYALIVIRSEANPPMDQNSPEDIFTLGNYLSRDQYGDTPLLYGPAYNSEVALDVKDGYCSPRFSEGAPIYSRKEKTSPDEKDSYFVVNHKTKYVYAQNMLFPRMWNHDHARNYELSMGGVKGYNVAYDKCGETVQVKMPYWYENLRFFFQYQMNFMYWRYFMWNFAGRQNGLQSVGELEHGQWLTGFSAIDNLRLGDQSKLPKELREDKGHNVYYCLPLLLGLLGLFWQLYRGRRGVRQFWVVGFLFFMTGIAIVLYLNQTPSQPRERDYAYAGSFYAFAIWCGLGVLAITDWLKKLLKNVNPTVVAAVVSLLCLIVPVQMASQNWDDHDRSGRYTCRDFGQNYLMTLQDEGNPIIFTNGDNDTFPLWYNMDVEGVRTDARVCNFSYLNTDWYIDQMKRPAYESPSVPITWPRLDFCSGTNEYVQIVPQAKKELLEYYKQYPEEARKQYGENPFELKNILKYWVRSKDEQNHFIPTDTIYMTIDKEAVRRSGMMMVSDSIPDQMVISLAGKRGLTKANLITLEMIAQCNWTRPLYIAWTVGAENYMNLGDNFINEGLANRISPFNTVREDPNDPENRTYNVMDTDKMYRNMMTRYKFGNLEQKGLYLDETTLHMCWTHRRLFGRLAQELIKKGENEKALKVLRKCEKVIPEYNVPLNCNSGGHVLAESYAKLGQKARAKQLVQKLYQVEKEYAQYYIAMGADGYGWSDTDLSREFYYLQRLVQIMELVDQNAARKMATEVNLIYQNYQAAGGMMQPGA